LKVHRHENKHAKRIIAAMIWDPTVAARVASRWKPEGLFASRHENMIAGWCVKYISVYDKPIGRYVLALFDEWAQGPGKNQEATIGLVEKLLGHVMEEYEHDGEDHSADYVIDLAGKHFDEVRMKQLVEEVQDYLEVHDVDAAYEEIMKLNRVELGQGAIFKPGEDYEGWREALDMSQLRPLITYPGPLGKFLGSELARDSFVVFMGSAKRGKSWWLLDAAYRAARQRRRVVYFEAGDLSHRQVKLRMAMRALRRPKPGDGGTFEVPIEFEKTDGDEPERKVKAEKRKLAEVTASEVLREWKRIQRKKDLFRLSCHSNSSLSVQMISATLQDWAREDWVADVVVIDYADILAPPAGITETREKVNESWKHLRRISQDFHCLVLTATQADASSYKQGLLGRWNFTDDRRKHDHVTAMIGINVTDEDKEKQVSRLNYIDRRGDAFTERSQVHVAGCLDIGCPAIKSTY
jgi:hypothetical protein